MEDLNKLDKSLEQLQEDFNSQLVVLGAIGQDFHNALIDLTAKYPEHKELLQFIVFINDKLETSQSLFGDIVVDSFNDLIRHEKNLINKLIKEKENNTDIDTIQKNPKSVIKTSLNTVNYLKDTKVIVMGIAIIVITIGAIVSPDTFLLILKSIAKLI